MILGSGESGSRQKVHTNGRKFLWQRGWDPPAHGVTGSLELVHVHFYIS